MLLTILTLYLHLHLQLHYTVYTSTNYNIYNTLLNSQPRIMHFAYSDWFTQSLLSAHIA